MINIISTEAKTYYFPVGVKTDASAFVLRLYSDLSKHTTTFNVTKNSDIDSKNYYAIMLTVDILESIADGEYNYELKDGETVVSKGLLRMTNNDGEEFDPGEDYVVYGAENEWITTKDCGEIYDEGYEDGRTYERQIAQQTISDLNDLIWDQADTIRELQSDLNYKDEIISEQEDLIYSVEYTTFTENGVYETNFEDYGVMAWYKVTVDVPTYDEGYEACYDDYNLGTIDYLSFTSTQDGSAIAMNIYNNRQVTIQYSTDKKNWIDWDFSEIELNSGDTVYMRGELGTTNNGSKLCRFAMTGSINAAGNCYTIVNRTGEQKIIGGAYFLSGLFKDCQALKTAPKMPSTGIGWYTCNTMFENSGIIQAPELPATLISTGSYRAMFNNCRNLEKAPTILPATQVPGQGYYCMFQECIKLTESPIICATSIAANSSVLGRMFWDCTNLEVLTTYIASYTEESIVYGNNKAGQWRNLGNCNTEGRSIVPATWTILTLQ